MSIELRDAAQADLPAILAINQSCIPEVSALTAEKLQALVLGALLCRVAVHQRQVAGFILCLGPSQAYESMNYTWFKARYEQFVYIDRIALMPRIQRQGVGQRMYEETIALAVRFGGRVTCEVNIRPRNDASLAFHDQLGFRSVGEQDTDGGAKAVTMLVHESASDSK